jgi:hypothetical protein
MKKIERDLENSHLFSKFSHKSTFQPGNNIVSLERAVFLLLHFPPVTKNSVYLKRGVLYSFYHLPETGSFP